MSVGAMAALPALAILARVVSYGSAASWAAGAKPAMKPGAIKPFAVNAITAGTFNALFLAFFSTALLLLHHSGYSPVEAALVLCPVALAMACTTPLTRHISRVVPPVWATTNAIICCAAAYVWFAADISGDHGPRLVALVGMSGLIGLAFILGFVAFNVRAVSFAVSPQASNALSSYQVLVQSGAALSIPLMASAAQVAGLSPVTGWPLIIAIGGIGLCALAAYPALSTLLRRPAHIARGVAQ